MLPILKPTRVVALSTDRSLESVVPDRVAGLCRLPSPHFTPAHAGSFIYGDNMRRQLNLFDGQIHLRNPLFQHV
jgi:hypothetical protein